MDELKHGNGPVAGTFVVSSTGGKEQFASIDCISELGSFVSSNYLTGV